MRRARVEGVRPTIGRGASPRLAVGSEAGPPQALGKSTMPIHMSGVHHVGLSVTDVQRSKEFYVELFGWKEVGSDNSLGYAFLSDGKNTITLWQQSDSPYARSHAGLHHLALAVNGADELIRAEQILRKRQIRIHYDRIVPVAEGGKAAELYCYDPDGICIELYSDEGGDGREAPVSHGPSCLLRE